MVRDPIGRGRGPSGQYQTTDRESAGQDAALEFSNRRIINQRMIAGRNDILPELCLGRDVGSDVTRHRPHIPVGQFEPRFGEGLGKGVRILMEAL